MKRARVVIGSGFGDEGKGLMTDYFAAQEPGQTVIRFSGGANAGHTVVAPDGRRHVFSHYGAGTLAGAHTFLSQYFIVNPMAWQSERLELFEIGVNPDDLEFYVDPRARVTTPYDILLNWEIERSRTQRHGSTGMGINETVHRNEKTRHILTMAHISGNAPSTIFHIVDRIRKEYVPARLESLGVTPSDFILDMLNSESLMSDFMNAAEHILRRSTLRMPDTVIKSASGVIFEGSQGLMLDEDHEFFPHVTRSKTGLANVVNMIEAAHLDKLDVTYVTRCYATRHGAGPLPHHDPGLSYHDDTNAPGEFQETMRFAPLDTALVSHNIRRDMMVAKGLDVTWNLSITHCDQMRDDFYFEPFRALTDNRSIDALADAILKATGIENYFLASGPTRETVAPAIHKVL